MVSLQNGVDNEDVLVQHVGARHVMGVVAFIFSEIAGPGVILQTGGPRRILFGELDGSQSERGEALARACRTAGIDAEARQDIRRLLWDKLALICAHGAMTATVRLPIGQIREVPEAMEMFGRIAEEVRAVAAAEGVDIGEEAAQRHESFARTLEPASRSSLHDDLVRGKRRSWRRSTAASCGARAATPSRSRPATPSTRSCVPGPSGTRAPPGGADAEAASTAGPGRCWSVMEVERGTARS